MKREEKITDRFLAHDSEGNPCTILEFTEQLHAETFSGPIDAKGHRWYMTQDGRRLNRISDSEFETVERPPIHLTRDDS